MSYTVKNRMGLAVLLGILLAPLGSLYAQSSSGPVFHSLGLRATAAYGHNQAVGLDPWRALIIGGGSAAELNLFRWPQLKMGLAIDAVAELYALPAGQRPYYLGEKGYINLFSLRFENRLSVYPVDFLYFGAGFLLSWSLTGALGDGDRGQIETYKPFWVPYLGLHFGYKHRKPLFGKFRWAVEIDAKIAVAKETHLELGGKFVLAYHF